ncbi:MAG: hypothetical protein CMJ47_05605 [Planctomyces sp.]|nr:hypothetical protein [Planctomyces sp.]
MWQKENGRPAKVFCNYRPRYPAHEAMLTEELLDWRIPLFDWKRSILTDSELKPDAQYKELMIEYDTGTESRRQVTKQASRYHKKDVLVVWVFQSATRFGWVQGKNTLVKLAGSSEVYSTDGNRTSVDGVCQMIKSGH